MITPINSFDEFQQALEHDGLLLVNFSSESCGPCKMMMPTLEELDKEHESLKIVTVDGEDLQEIGLDYKVYSLPTYYVFKKKKIVRKLAGYNPNTAAFKKNITDHL